MEITTYIIPTDPEFYGAATEEEAARCAGVLMQELSIYVIEQAVQVEFKKSPIINGYRGTGDEDIISALLSLENVHLKEWLTGVLA